MYDSNMQHEAKGKNSCERKAAGRRPLSSEAARERDGKLADAGGASFKCIVQQGFLDVERF